METHRYEITSIWKQIDMITYELLDSKQKLLESFKSLNIPSNHDKLIDLMETHRYEIASIWN